MLNSFCDLHCSVDAMVRWCYLPLYTRTVDFKSNIKNQETINSNQLLPYCNCLGITVNFIHSFQTPEVIEQLTDKQFHAQVKPVRPLIILSKIKQKKIWR